MQSSKVVNKIKEP
jgi:hypothetical protein